MTNSTIARRRVRLSLLATALAAALGGCATTAAGPVEVSRFARPELAAAPRGTVSVIAAPGSDGTGIAFGAYAAAVSRELTRLGYAPAPGAGTVAEVAFERLESEPAPRRSPVSVGLGGSTGGYGSGVGLGLGINLSGGPKRMVEMRLAVTLRDATTGLALWEGRARFAAPVNTPLADSPAGATRLAQALFQGFPGRSGETVIVR